MKPAFIISVTVLASFVVFSTPSLGQYTVEIKTNPSNATVYQDNRYIGVTPLTLTYDPGCFKTPRWLFSKRLGNPISFTISKEGYVQKNITITDGPFRWESIDGKNTFFYYKIKAHDFFVQLDQIGTFLGSNPQKNKEVAENQAKGTSKNKLDLEKSLLSVVTITTETSTGSGFFINPSGLIVTNKHVVEKASSVKIMLAEGESYFSESIYTHPSLDLALIKVTLKSPEYLSFGDVSSSKIGESVYALGSPALPGYQETLPNSITKGIISGFRNSDTFGLLIQTDVSINHGNSGGPLINEQGVSSN